MTVPRVQFHKIKNENLEESYNDVASRTMPSVYVSIDQKCEMIAGHISKHVAQKILYVVDDDIRSEVINNIHDLHLDLGKITQYGEALFLEKKISTLLSTILIFVKEHSSEEKKKLLLDVSSSLVHLHGKAAAYITSFSVDCGD